MKKLVALILSTALLVILMSVPVEAKWDVKTVYSGEHYRIRYAGNSRYLDIPADGYTNNGTQLQIWDYAEGNQNQIFKLVDTGNGWHILSRDGKIVEVRDNRHDDGAPVAQWDSHNLKCGLWDIQSNNDGSYSFRNRESGKYLNVCGGGNACNGTEIIQWYNDGTEAMRFYLEILRYEDVKSAVYTRQRFRKSEIQWLKHEKNSRDAKDFAECITDCTGLGYEDDNYVYTPCAGRIFYSMEFLAPDVVAQILMKECYRTKPSIWNTILSAAAGEVDSAIVGTISSTIKLGPIAGFAFGLTTSICKDIVQIDQNDNDEWNRFVDAAYPKGNVIQGVIVYHYYDIKLSPLVPSYNSFTSQTLYKAEHTEYKSWDGNNFSDVWHPPVDTSGCKGSWTLLFK